MRRAAANVLLGSVLFLGSAVPSAADTSLGVQGSYADDTDFGVGARLVFGVGRTGAFSLIGSFDYFFPEGDATYWEVNGNLAYDLGDDVYIGAGANLARGSFGNADNADLGLNLLGGIHLGDNLYGEVRTELGGGDQSFIVTLGLLL